MTAMTAEDHQLTDGVTAPWLVVFDLFVLSKSHRLLKYFFGTQYQKAKADREAEAESESESATMSEITAMKIPTVEATGETTAPLPCTVMTLAEEATVSTATGTERT